jgi:hypothetical protein
MTSRRDTQDTQFGATAAADQEWVDQLEDEGVDADQLPDQPAARPRAAGKAEPAPADPAR